MAEKRLYIMCHVIVANEFTKRSDLDRAPDPVEWLDACRLTVEEIKFLRQVKHVGSTVPMWVSHARRRISCVCVFHDMLLQVTFAFTMQEEVAAGRA